jgi:sensor histidine kinase YesM
MHSQSAQSVLIGSDKIPKVWSAFRYRHLPVFSWPWVWARTRCFSLWIALYFSYKLTYLGYATHRFWLPAFIGFLQFTIWALTAWAGPAAVTAIKARHLTAKRETWYLVAAVLGCVSISIVLQDLNRWFFYQRFLLPVLMSEMPAAVRDLYSVEPSYATILLHLSMLTMGLFVAGGLPLLSYLHESRRTSAEKMKQEVSLLRRRVSESDSRLAILQAQIEPHFLFNTLASVKALVTQDAVQATKMIDAMSDHLRTVLPKLRDEKSASCLGEQLDICASYLRLMQLRMGERFSFEINVPLSLLATQTPPLLLLPLVENAVTHGVEPKPGQVRISIVVLLKTDDALQIEVHDNGIGLAAAAGKQHRQGVGLANVREQLAIRYGDEAWLEITSGADGGTSAKLTIPKNGQLDTKQ